MALDVKDGNGVNRTLKTSLDGSDHVPHHMVDNFPSGGATETTLAAVLAKILAAPSTEAKQDIIITALAAILAKLIASPSTEAKQDTQVTALGTLATQTTAAAILAKIIAAPATEAKQDSLLAAILPTISRFRNLAANSTAVAVKASAGELWGYNIINLQGSDIYIKIYNIAAASVNPASDVPVMTLLLPASGTIFQEPAYRLDSFSTAISIRAVTGSGDTSTATPTTSPIIELKYL